jgi:hypothetical protein
MLAGLLYVLVGAALLAARVDVYCMRYTGTSAAVWNATCDRGGGCAAGRCTVVPEQIAALLAFKASGGAATATTLASWRSGTDPCGGKGCGHRDPSTYEPTVDAPCPWAGVTCSGGAAPAVTGLTLDDGPSGKFRSLVGDVGTLLHLGDLTILDLALTDVAGEAAALAPLTRLTYLNLWGTKVTGQAAALAPLTGLTGLDLGGTAVAGCDAFCAPGGPFHSHCDQQHGADSCYCTCS